MAERASKAKILAKKSKSQELTTMEPPLSPVLPLSKHFIGLLTHKHQPALKLVPEIEEKENFEILALGCQNLGQAANVAVQPWSKNSSVWLY